jgi:hypothetical protein
LSSAFAAEIFQIFLCLHANTKDLQTQTGFPSKIISHLRSFPSFPSAVGQNLSQINALPGERSAIELLAVCTGVALEVMLSILDERRKVLNISEHPAITKTHSGCGVKTQGGLATTPPIAKNTVCLSVCLSVFTQTLSVCFPVHAPTFTHCITNTHTYLFPSPTKIERQKRKSGKKVMKFRDISSLWLIRRRCVILGVGEQEGKFSV